jgi:hypothetical protein
MRRAAAWRRQMPVSLLERLDKALGHATNDYQ